MKARIYLSGAVLSIGTKRADKMFEYAEKCLISAEKRAKRHYRELNILLNLLKDELETLDNLIAIETGGWNVRPTY